MPLCPTLPARLQRQLQRLAKERLQKALDAFGHFSGDTEEPEVSPAWTIMLLDPLDFPSRTARDANWLLDHRPRDRDWGEMLLGHLDQLKDAYRIAATKPATPAERQNWLASLTGVTTLMIRVLTRQRRYAEAIELVDRHRDLMLSKPYRNVAGAGSTGVHGEHAPHARHILLSVVLWAAVVAFRSVAR
jgi:hypothetical protein